MATRPVTPDASAASFEELSTPNSVILPTDKEYRKTGVLPSEETADEEKPKEKEPTSSEEDDVKTAAASEAAKSQKEEKKSAAQEKSPESRENRWQKRERELRESREESRKLRERLDRLEAGKTEQRPAAETKTEAKTEAKTAANPKPKIDDVDAKTGKPKYSSYAEFDDAKDEWNRKEAVREFNETSAKTAKERDFQQAQQTIATEWGKRVESAKSKYNDYESVALNPELPIKQGSVVDVFILSRPNGTDVLYHLGANRPVLDQINAMSPIDAAYALSEIAFKLASDKAEKSGGESGDKSSSSSEKPISQAPRPPHQTNGKGAVVKDAAAQAAEEGDFEVYQREMNQRELARRKKGK
ncbi:MAG TPA: hypothetical protein VGG46_04035 [Terriglobales bacterium]|jgi:hypothetical protein